MNRHPAVPVLAFAALAVSTLVALASTPPAELTGAEWVLESVDGKPVPATKPPRLSVDATGRVSGFAGCNRFFGRFVFEDQALMVSGGLGLTRMACPPEVMTLEKSFSRALEEATRWSRSGSSLTLEGDGGKLVFRRGN